MAHGPGGEGARVQYTQAREPPAPASATAHRPVGTSWPLRVHFFPRFAPTPRGDASAAADRRWYIRPLRARPLRPSRIGPSNAPWKESLGRCPRNSSSLPAWRTIRAELVSAVGESTYEIWLAPLEVKAWDGRVLLLAGAGGRPRPGSSKRFGRVLETLRAGGPRRRRARISFASGEPRAAARPTAPIAPDGDPDTGRSASTPATASSSSSSATATGSPTRAALAVAELPGQAYNPLFLYAPPGLGKTHLLHAIGNYVLAFGGGATVRYTTVEAFTNQFITRARLEVAVERFKHAYRDADVLLIDDVQFLASKAKTEEEFFHTFNALYETGRQLVLTCDRLPRALLDDRGAPARALRGRAWSPTSRRRTSPRASRSCASAPRSTAIALADPAVLELIAERVTTTSARSRAR